MSMAPDPEASQPRASEPAFSVSHQCVDLEIDLNSRSLRGKTELTICPHSKELRAIGLNARQCNVRSAAVNGRAVPNLTYTDPYQRAGLPWRAGVHQFHMFQERLEPFLKDASKPELIVNLPKSLRIEEMDPFSEEAQGLLLSRILGSGKKGSDVNAIDLAQGTRAGVENSARYTPFTLSIHFEIDHIRDGMHFAGFGEGDDRFPHAYTTITGSSQSARNLFPCVDESTSRSTWEISITCAKTIGIMLSGSRPSKQNHWSTRSDMARRENNFSEDDKSREFTVICSGETIDEVASTEDDTQKTFSFICSKDLAPQQLGFCIGTFERIDLAEFRDGDEDDLLQQNAVPMHAFCLPGRREDTRNTCLPLARAIDFITVTYGSFPFPNYKICFVDDLEQEVVHAGMLSICSNHLLYPDNVLDTIESATRTLVHALASQWIGVDIIPRATEDRWAIVGMAHSVTDNFMGKLCGKNDLRFKQKRRSERVVELDVDRPSLLDLGALIDLDTSELELMTLKAPLVLYILDQRLTKTGSSSGICRIIMRIFLNAKVGDLVNGVLDTAYFVRLCEKIGHTKLESFFAQWVEGSGCPRFRVSQRFNKKKLVVEMSIQQVQSESLKDKSVESRTFMRDVKEEQHEMYGSGVYPCFTGPMTIRIHEADGTPYEHIVEIKEALQRFEIPYNTKYKRLKRGRRQRERHVNSAPEYAGDGTDDVLLYSLGDVLQSEDDVKDWRLAEWSKEDETKMSEESYEWIRMDADFEWICKLSLTMPGYMWVSQLQQDRDVVAQLESIEYLESQKGHPLISTFLVRTLMDKRYFHGVRTAAANALVQSAQEELGWIGLFHLEKSFQEMFCYLDSMMTLPNDFSDRTSYMIQCSIPVAISLVRDKRGKAPFRTRRWLLNKLKYNDNSDNEVSDGAYVAILVRALASAVATNPPHTRTEVDAFDNADDDDVKFHQACLGEIERYRKLDEWIPSYQNVVSVTALDSLRSLARVGALKVNAIDFLQYTEEGILDALRLEAFSDLMQLGFARVESILRWFLVVLGTDPSPYIRKEMISIFGRYLGAVALGEKLEPSIENVPQDSFVVEVEASTDSRKADLARKQSISGAVTALKSELSFNTTLQEGLWEAISSPNISLKQQWQLLDICDLLYVPHTSMIVALRYPRFWKCTRVGRGQVVFSQTNRIRTQPLPKRPIKLKLTTGASGSDTLGGVNGSSEPRKQSSSIPPSPASAYPRSFLKPPKPPPHLHQPAPPLQRPNPPLQRKQSTSSVDSGGGAESPPPGSDGGKPKVKLKLKLGGGAGRFT